MGHSIIKLNDGTRDYYLEYSGIVDAPLTYGMTLEEFKEYYRDEYGRDGFKRLEQRLSRVEEKGTSNYSDASVDDTILCNRAGKNETRLTKQQMIEMYCHGPHNEIVGVDWLAEIMAEEAEELKRRAETKHRGMGNTNGNKQARPR
jgi:hypothetical protein